jgi:excisionase family DNA binding protein
MSELSEVKAELTELKTLLLHVLEQVSRHGEDSARLLKPAEAAPILGCKVTKVYAMMATGEIPTIQIGEGGHRRIPLVALRAMIAEKLKESGANRYP